MKWANMIGDEAVFSVEHQMLNILLLSEFIVGLLTGVFNIIFQLTGPTILSGSAVIITAFLYYISLVKKQYLVPAYATVLMMLVIIPGIWLCNGGIDGGAPFFIMITSSIIAILFRGVKRICAIGVLLLVNFLLMIVSYQYPELIMGYETKFAWYADYGFSLVILLLANVAIYGITLMQFERKHERARRYAAEIERHKTELEMARLERLNVIGETAASIAHEVRNPLTTVRGYLQFFSRKKEFAQNSEQLDIIISEIDRADGIISEFLSLAKNKTVSFEKLNINQVIDSLYPLLSAVTLSENKVIRLELEDVPDIKGDEGEMRQLILNLARNAKEAVCEHGQIILSTKFDGEMVELAVKDNGSGMSQEVLDKVGTPFFTTKETGTGLGLAVCYRIAERHGGMVLVETSSEGTAFYFKFKAISEERVV
ncbi:MAG: domain S-box [Firmicutes bacterium]|nr:domain S-box [Bacillota bacterium]